MLTKLQGGTGGVQSGRASSLLAASVETAGAAGQPLLRTSASAAKQESSELDAAASFLPPKAAVTADRHQPQSPLSSQHEGPADAEVQQSDSVRHQCSHTVTGLCDLDQQEAVCASVSQQQCIASHLPGAVEPRGSGEQRQGSCRATSPDPVQATDRILLEHCAAGRSDCCHGTGIAWLT